MVQGTQSLIRQLHPEALGLMVEPVLGGLYQQHIGSFWKS